MDDLTQEAALAYWEALKSYDPNKGKLSTYMWWVMVSRLKNYRGKENKYTDAITLSENPVIDKPISRPSFFDSLTKEARDIAEVILSSPADFDLLEPKKARLKVINKLRGMRWSAEKIDQGIKELKLVFN